MPKYLPSLNPAPPLDFDEWNQSRLDFLLRSYRDSEANLSRMLQQHLTDFQRSRTSQLLTQVRAEIIVLNKRAKSWAKDGIEHAYRYGWDLTNRTVREYGIAPQVEFGNQINTRAVSVLAEQAALDLTGANGSIANGFSRFYRLSQQKVVEDQALTRAITQGLIEGQKLAQISSAVGRKLKDALGNGRYITINGRNYKPSYYANMVAVTRTKEASVIGVLNTAIQLGMTLVRWDVHGDPCPVCRTRMGRVYSLVDGNADFPPLSIRPPVHPHCLCSLYPITDIALKARNEYVPLSELSKSSPQTLDEKTAEEWLKKNPEKDIITLVDMKNYLDLQKPKSIQVPIEMIESPPKEASIIPLRQVRAPVEIPIPESAAEAEIKLQEILRAETKLSIELARSQDSMRRTARILQEVERTVQLLPEAAKSLSEKPIRQIRLWDVSNFKRSRSLSIYQSEPPVISVAMKNQKKLSSLKLGGWSVDKSLEGSVRHAIGHHLARSIPQVELKAFESILSILGLAQIASSISAYAASSTEEAFAESFTAFTHPDYNDRSLPREIHLFLKRLLGEPQGEIT